MKKTLTIEGMMCAHCSNRVEKLFKGLGASFVQVDLEEKSCMVTFDMEILDKELVDSVTTEGYEVTSIR